MAAMHPPVALVLARDGQDLPEPSSAWSLEPKVDFCARFRPVGCRAGEVAPGAADGRGRGGRRLPLSGKVSMRPKAVDAPGELRRQRSTDACFSSQFVGTLNGVTVLVSVSISGAAADVERRRWAERVTPTTRRDGAVSGPTEPSTANAVLGRGS
jgi:hypothetical protein